MPFSFAVTGWSVDIGGGLLVALLAASLLQTVGFVEGRGAAAEKKESPAISDGNVAKEEKGLVFGAIMPHGPDIILEVTKDPTLMAETRRAMEEAARRFAAARVDTLILLDPEIIHTRQGEALAGSRSFFHGDSVLSIGTAVSAGGRLGLSEERFECDTKLANAIFDAGCNGGFPVVKDAGDKDKGELPLQGGSLIPLWYSIRPLPRPRPQLVVISPSTMVPRAKLISFGQLIAKIAKDSGKRVAMIASADQGHRHDKNHPRFGFSPFAAQYDALYCEAVSSNHLEKLLDISNEVLEGSFTDSFWQTLILAGGLKAAPMDITFFNYARPSYYGMVVATFGPHTARKAPDLSKP